VFTISRLNAIIMLSPVILKVCGQRTKMLLTPMPKKSLEVGPGILISPELKVLSHFSTPQ